MKNYITPKLDIKITDIDEILALSAQTDPETDTEVGLG